MVIHKGIKREFTAHQGRRRATAAAREEQRLPPDSAIPAQQALPETPRLPDASAAASTGGLDISTRGGRKDTPVGSRPGRQAAKPAREPTPHDRRALYGILLVLGILVASLAVSIPSGKSIFIFGYIAAIVYVTNGPMWRNRPWQELGLKRGFLTDLRGVWYLVAVVAVLFQVLPPSFGIARLSGYYPELVQHVSARLPVTIGSQKGVATLAGLLVVMLVLTLMEELVFRVTIQERLSWFIGTPAAILIASVLFAAAHAVVTSGSTPVILADTAGVAIDGVLFGIIYAKTHNLALTWATHYAADVVAIIALLVIF
jgi:membrane protease YdiL (CAAX protease family)